MDHDKAMRAAMALGVSTDTDYPPHGLAPGTGHLRACTGWSGPGPGPGYGPLHMSEHLNACTYKLGY